MPTKKTRSQNLELRSSMAVSSGVQSQNIKWSPKLKKKFKIGSNAKNTTFGWLQVACDLWKISYVFG
jgi:hypothetical protein